jgi:hypothetical protein
MASPILRSGVVIPLLEQVAKAGRPLQSVFAVAELEHEGTHLRQDAGAPSIAVE